MVQGIQRASAAMTLPPAAEVLYSEIQRMLEVDPQYGIEFVLPKTK